MNSSLSKERISICLSCDRLLNSIPGQELLGLENCKECGCFIRIKSKLENQKCPLGKW